MEKHYQPRSSEAVQYKIRRTTATDKIFALRKRIRAVAGGTSASKTISILIWLIDYAQSSRDELLSVVSESFPHLEKGAILDFKMIMKDRKYWNEDRWNETKHTYEFETGTKLEFFSSDAAKAHGPRRDVLFLNEAQHLPYAEVDQLMVRTRKIVWLDWNPTIEFWYYTEPRFKEDDVDFLTLTYKDNEALDEQTIKEIEAHRNNKSWWRVYGEGQLGEVEGRIYTGWQIIDAVPFEARLERYGLDFGWNPDYSSLVAIYYYNGGYILDEVNTQLEWANREIAGTIKNLPKALVIADSAEPKSISEIKDFGVNVTGAIKGADSVRHGIKVVQDQRISVTRNSANILKGYRNWLWARDKNGLIIPGVTEHEPDPLAASRYGLCSLLPIIRRRELAPRTVQKPRFKTNVAV